MTEYAKLVVAVDSTAAKSASGDLNTLTESGKKAESGMAGLKDKAALAGAAIAAAATAVVAMTKASIDAADAASDNAQAAGTTTENYTRMAYAMRFGAGGAADLDGSMKFLNKSMFDAANGSAQASMAFDRLGIAYTNTDGSLRDSTDVMLDVAERFSTMKDGAEKSALAMDIFGKSGAEIIPFLNQGKDGISALTEQADRLGITLSGDVADAAGQFNDNIEILKGAAQGFGNQVMKGLLPALNNLGNEMVATADNGDQMASAADGVVAILKGVVSVAVTVSAALQGIGNAIGGIAAATVAALSGDFKGAAQIMSDLHTDTVNLTSQTMSRIAAIWDDNATAVEQAEARKRSAVHATMSATGGGATAKTSAAAPAAGAGTDNFQYGAGPLASIDAMIAEAEANDLAYNTAKMERLNAQFMTEREAEILRYEQQMEDFRFYAEQKQLAEDDVNRRIEEMQLIHGQNMAGIASKNNASVLTQTLSGLQGIAGAFAGHSKTMFKVMKAASIAQGLLSIKTGIANAMALPFPANLAAAATVAAQGASIMADIRSLTDSGGGKGISAPSGGGVSVMQPGMSGGSAIINQTAPRQQAIDIRLTGIRPDDMITGSYLQKIVEGIGETLSNNGGRMGNVELVTV